MRIKLSDYEEHSIKVKDIYEPAEFFEFVERLNYLARMVKKDFLVNQTFEEEKESSNKIVKEKRKYVKSEKYLKEENSKDGKKVRGGGLERVWCNTKEKVINILKLHYFGDSKQKEKFAKDVGESWQNINKSFYSLKNRFNITSKDVGLKRFPIKGELMNKLNKTQVLESLKIKK